MTIAHQLVASVWSQGCEKKVEQALTVQLASRQTTAGKGCLQEEHGFKTETSEMINYFSLFSSEMRNIGLKSRFSKLI